MTPDTANLAMLVSLTEKIRHLGERFVYPSSGFSDIEKKLSRVTTEEQLSRVLGMLNSEVEMLDNEIHRIREQERLNHEFQTIDEISGLHNKRGLIDIFKREQKIAYRNNSSLAFVMIYLHHFNESRWRGAVAETPTPRLVAEVMRNTIRPGDHVARISISEFIIVLPTSDLENATMVGHRLIQNLIAFNHDMSESIFESVYAGSAEFFSSDTIKTVIDRLEHGVAESMSNQAFMTPVSHDTMQEVY